MRRSEGPNNPERAYLSIREVLELLVEEFPEVTISKIRFLEGKGLIHPERTPSGYRKFYVDDVERLRWILRQQREHFLPLKVIKGRLEQVGTASSELSDVSPLGDAGVVLEEAEQPALVGASLSNGVTQRQAPASRAHRAVELPTRPLARRAAVEPRVAAAPEQMPLEDFSSANDEEQVPSLSEMLGAEHERDAPELEHYEEFPPTSMSSLSAHQLVESSGAALSLINDLEAFGLISSREVAGERCFDQGALQIASLASSFARFGVEPRHLKAFKHAAERDAGLFGQVVVPLLRQHNSAARQRALHELGELVSLGEQLRAAFVQTELRGLTGE